MAIAGILTYMLYVGQESGVQKFHAESMRLLFEKYPDVFKSDTEYSFYTTGHPYVWVGISYKDALRYLVDACRGYRGMPQPALYSLRVDKDRKNVYLVSGIKDFNFSKLMHYDEWLVSNRQVAKKIEDYKKL